MNYIDIKNKLAMYDLHDVPIQAIDINFEGDFLTFVLELFSEKIDTYEEKKFIFSKIGNLNIPQKKELNYLGLELYGYDLNQKSNNCKIELIFLQGLSEPDWTISFDFVDLEVR